MKFKGLPCSVITMAVSGFHRLCGLWAFALGVSTKGPPIVKGVIS